MSTRLVLSLGLAVLVALLVPFVAGCREGRSEALPSSSKHLTEGKDEAPKHGPAVPLTSKADLEARKKELTSEQYDVTQNEGTEPPFENPYWNQHEPGIYVDVVSGEPLFSSNEKYDSGTGWPSFTAPLAKDVLVEKTDTQLGYPRTEVRSKIADSHLGHVFDDGPKPTGLRYCMNSAALRFVPAARLVVEGYGSYASLFPGVKQLEK